MPWRRYALSQCFYIYYSNTTKNSILFIDVSASRRKPSSGLTSGAGRQYVKACPTRGSTGVNVTKLITVKSRMFSIGLIPKVIEIVLEI